MASVGGWTGRIGLLPAADRRLIANQTTSRCVKLSRRRCARMRLGSMALILLAGGAAFGFQAYPVPPAPPARPAMQGQPGLQGGPGQMQAPVVPVVPGRGSIEGQVVNLATGMPLKRANVRVQGLGRPQPGGM